MIFRKMQVLWGISVEVRLSNVLRSHHVHIILFVALAWSKLCLVNLLCLGSREFSPLTVRKKKVYLDFCVVWLAVFPYVSVSSLFHFQVASRYSRHNSAG